MTTPARRRYKLRKLEVDRIDTVDRGANQGAHIVIAKNYGADDPAHTDARADFIEALKRKKKQGSAFPDENAAAVGKAFPPPAGGGAAAPPAKKKSKPPWMKDEGEEEEGSEDQGEQGGESGEEGGGKKPPFGQLAQQGAQLAAPQAPGAPAAPVPGVAPPAGPVPAPVTGSGVPGLPAPAMAPPAAPKMPMAPGMAPGMPMPPAPMPPMMPPMMPGMAPPMPMPVLPPAMGAMPPAPPGMAPAQPAAPMPGMQMPRTSGDLAAMWANYQSAQLRKSDEDDGDGGSGKADGSVGKLAQLIKNLGWAPGPNAMWRRTGDGTHLSRHSNAPGPGQRSMFSTEEGGAPTIRRTTAPSSGARLQIRSSTFRGKEGFLIVGKDTKGRRVDIFVEDRNVAENVRDQIKAGTEVDFGAAGVRAGTKEGIDHLVDAKPTGMKPGLGEFGDKLRAQGKQPFTDYPEEGRSVGSTKSGHRSLSTIAQEIRRDWGSKVNYAAKPYLDAMGSLDDITGRYGMDSADSVVAYFLSNASSWRGDKARAIKAELNAILKTPHKQFSQGDHMSTARPGSNRVTRRNATFDDWMKAVDREVGRKYMGLSYLDLPDIAYRDMYDDGSTSSAAANKAIRMGRE